MYLSVAIFPQTDLKFCVMKSYLRLHRSHYNETIKLGLPVVISQLGQITVGLADNIMIGQMGTTVENPL